MDAPETGETSTPASDNPPDFSGKSGQRDAATCLAKHGLKVMRLPPGKRFSPFGDDWPLWDRNTPKQVFDFWSDDHGNPLDYNIAVQTGRNFIVIDIDFRKGGAPSYHNIKALMSDSEPTFTVKTPGGIHLYFQHHDDMRSGTNVLDHVNLPGVDLKAHNSYVVGPGSVREDGSYSILHGTPANMAPLPDFLLNWLGSRPLQPKIDQTPIFDPDSQIYSLALHQAKVWLSSPDGLDGRSCDGATYNTAAKMKDFGLSVDDAVDVLFAHERAIGEIADPGGMERSIRNAYDYATGNRPGEALRVPAEMEFEPVELHNGTHLPSNGGNGEDGGDGPGAAERESGGSRESRQKTLVFERWSKVEDVDVDWLVDGILPKGGFAALYGQPGSYKSFLALQIGASIASGSDFMGRECGTGDVLYIMAEGGFGLRRRLDAIEAVHGIAPDNMLFLRSAVDLRSTRESAEKIAAAAMAANLNVELVVIDTMARTFGGGNENSSEDIGAYISIVDDVLRARLGCCVLLVHHSGKDVARGMRGHNSLFAAVDAEIETEQLVKVRADGSRPGSGRIRITKQKEGPDGWELPFAVESVDVSGSRESDIKRTSLVVRPWEDGETVPDAAELMGADWGARMSVESVLDLHTVMADLKCRKDTRSPAWAGVALAEACGFHGIDGWKDKAHLALKRLHRTEAIEAVEGKDAKRMEREYWVPVLDNGLEWIDAVKSVLTDE